MSLRLTGIEREAYEFCKKHGELLTTNVPIRMMGTIPNLKSKGFVEVFKKRTSPWSFKKRKFVKAKKKE